MSVSGLSKMTELDEETASSSRAEFSSSIDSSIQIEEEGRSRSASFPAAAPRGRCLTPRLKTAMRMALWSLLLLLYNVYIGYAIHYNRARGKSLEWCNGIGFIIIITAVAYVCLVYLVY